MADLGATASPNGRRELPAVKFMLLWQNVGTYSPAAKTSAVREKSLFYVSWYNWLPYNNTWMTQQTYNVNGSIYGKVTISGIRQPKARVRLFDGGEFQIIGMMFTDALGEYRFNGLPKEYTNFTIMVDDPTGQYNQGRLDNLTPV